MSLQDKWILITGASSGLGLEMAKQLALNEKPNLILAARREENLRALKAEIREHVAIEIDVVPSDLSKLSDSQQLIEHCLSKPNFHGAILNAGVTYAGPHSAITAEKMNQLLQLNVVNTAHQLTAFVDYFENNMKAVRLMVVSSLAADFPLPYQALYSGTKAFLSNLTLSIRREIQNPHLYLSTLSPGGIQTELSQAPELIHLEKYAMPVELAAKDAIRCFLKGKFNYIPGRWNRLGIGFATVFIPKRAISSFLGKKFKTSIAKSKIQD